MYLDAIGTVTPVYTASITSQVTGLVIAVHFTEGQIVEKGDPLIDIDPRPYQATLLQAQGTLERDQAILAQATDGSATATATRGRGTRFRSRRWTTRRRWCCRMQGTVKNDQGTVQYDQVQVELLPHHGADLRAGWDCGWSIRATWCSRRGRTTLAVITQLQPITVIFTIPEDNLGQVQPRLRQRAKLPVDAFDRAALKKIASGTLLTLDNQIDTTTGTVKARASFDNKDTSLFPNQFVNTRLLVNTLQGVTLIPTSAIQHNGNGGVRLCDSGQHGAHAQRQAGRDGGHEHRR